jgi:hypothetical protein
MADFIRSSVATVRPWPACSTQSWVLSVRIWYREGVQVDGEFVARYYYSQDTTVEIRGILQLLVESTAVLTVQGIVRGERSISSCQSEMKNWRVVHDSVDFVKPGLAFRGAADHSSHPRAHISCCGLTRRRIPRDCLTASN